MNESQGSEKGRGLHLSIKCLRQSWHWKSYHLFHRTSKLPFILGWYCLGHSLSPLFKPWDSSSSFQTLLNSLRDDSCYTLPTLLSYWVLVVFRMGIAHSRWKSRRGDRDKCTSSLLTPSLGHSCEPLLWPSITIGQQGLWSPSLGFLFHLISRTCVFSLCLFKTRPFSATLLVPLNLHLC